jgi:hypothetical protein
MSANIIALLAGLLCCLGIHLPAAQLGGTKGLAGQDRVKWEDNWYPLDDGAHHKLMARRGIGDKGLWMQLRNDYDQTVHCRALVISILRSGEKKRVTHFPDLGPGATVTQANQAGEEIIKVEISDFVMG